MIKARRHDPREDWYQTQLAQIRNLLWVRTLHDIAKVDKEFDAEDQYRAAMAAAQRFTQELVEPWSKKLIEIISLRPLPPMLIEVSEVERERIACYMREHHPELMMTAPSVAVAQDTPSSPTLIQTGSNGNPVQIPND